MTLMVAIRNIRTKGRVNTESVYYDHIRNSNQFKEYHASINPTN